MQYARTCSVNDLFLNWDRLLINKLMLQGFIHLIFLGFIQSKLKSASWKFDGCHCLACYQTYFIPTYMFRPFFTPDFDYGLSVYQVKIYSHNGCHCSTWDAHSPRHLIPFLVYPKVYVCQISILYSLWNIRDWSKLSFHLYIRN